MNLKITYLDKAPDRPKRPYQNTALQSTITAFMKSDKPVMRVDLGDHYINPKVGRSSWAVAVSRSGYNLAVHLVAQENCIYIVKPDVSGKEG